jgi:hypothetical protein
MPTLSSLAPVLPVSDLHAALDTYRLLGFAAKPYQRAEVVPGQAPSQELYGFLSRDGLHVHLCEVADVDPRSNLCEVYIYVDDARELHRQWCRSGAPGSFVEPADTEYGLCEGAFVDLDGNSLRFGSWLPGFPREGQMLS